MATYLWHMAGHSPKGNSSSSESDSCQTHFLLPCTGTPLQALDIGIQNGSFIVLSSSCFFRSKMCKLVLNFFHVCKIQCFFFVTRRLLNFIGKNVKRFLLFPSFFLLLSFYETPSL